MGAEDQVKISISTRMDIVVGGMRPRQRSKLE
jgi:hypothetical protein